MYGPYLHLLRTYFNSLSLRSTGAALPPSTHTLMVPRQAILPRVITPLKGVIPLKRIACRRPPEGMGASPSHVRMIRSFARTILAWFNRVKNVAHIYAGNNLI